MQIHTQNLKVKILKVEWGKRETERVFTYAAHPVLPPVLQGHKETTKSLSESSRHIDRPPSGCTWLPNTHHKLGGLQSLLLALVGFSYFLHCSPACQSQFQEPS